jgi:DNA-binding LytR/AlgR family response regulator
VNYHYIIVDDEPLARNIIEKHLELFQEFKLVASVSSAVAALEILGKHKIDLVFLDIKMPVIDGLQMIRSLKRPPAVIYTTAFAEYAAESYDLDAVDYLLKPISPEGIKRGIAKFLKQLPPLVNEKEKFVVVKHNERLIRINFEEILWVESRKDYMLINTGPQTYLKHITMKAIVQVLPGHQFKRVHRSYLVAIKAIENISGDYLKIMGQTIPISEKYKKELLTAFRNNNLLP